MDEYGHTYPIPFPPMQPVSGEYPDHGDGFGEYYGLGPVIKQNDVRKRSTRSKHHLRRHNDSRLSRSRSNSASRSRSRSRSRSKSRSQSRSRSCTRSKSRSVSHSRSRSCSRRRDFIAPGFLDAFRVLYLKPSKSKQNTPKYLATKKRQDRIQELLKSDGLGSKRWLFYPRVRGHNDKDTVPGTRDNCDQRIKIDGEFFRKYKRNKKVDSNAPITKLKRWELLLYKKLGFIHAVS